MDYQRDQGKLSEQSDAILKFLVCVHRDFGPWGRPDSPPPVRRRKKVSPPPMNPWTDDPFGIGLYYHLP